MITATVADVTEFEGWPVEQQELAKRVLYATKPLATQSDVDHIREDLRDAEHSLDSARAALRLLEGKIR